MENKVQMKVLSNQWNLFFFRDAHNINVTKWSGYQKMDRTLLTMSCDNDKHTQSRAVSIVECKIAKSLKISETSIPDE